MLACGDVVEVAARGVDGALVFGGFLAWDGAVLVGEVFTSVGSEDSGGDQLGDGGQEDVFADVDGAGVVGSGGFAGAAKAVDLAADAGALDLLSGDLTYLAVGPLQVWRDRLLPTDVRDPIPNLVRIVAEWADPLPADRRATMLVLAAHSFRAGQELADRLITVLQPAWETVGVRHSGVALEPHGPVAVPEVWPVLGTPWHQVYEAASGWPISVMLPHEHVGGVQCAAMFVVDGAVRVVTGGSDGRLQVWDAATGVATSARFTAHVGPVTGVTMLGVGNDPWIVSTGYNGTITAHDAFTGDATMPTIHAQGSTSAVAVGLVAGAPRIVTGGSERILQLWDPLTGEPAGQHDTGHTGAICAVTVAELGGSTRIVTASEDRTIRVWDPDDHTCVGVIDCFDVPGLLAPFPNGSLGFKPSKTFSAYVWIRPGRPDSTEEASGTGTGGGRRHRQ